MKSIILSATARFLLPILFMFSLFLLVRGHNLPGGGFVGGLVAAAAFVLYAIAHDVEQARREVLARGGNGSWHVFFPCGLWRPTRIIG